MTVEITIPPSTSGFQEDKDLAKAIRTSQLLPALAAADAVTLDFGKVEYVTQSFVHALIGEPLRQYGESVLDRLEFKNCSSQLKTVIQLVVGYSFGGFGLAAEVQPPSTEAAGVPPSGASQGGGHSKQRSGG